MTPSVRLPSPRASERTVCLLALTADELSHSEDEWEEATLASIALQVTFYDATLNLLKG